MKKYFALTTLFFLTSSTLIAGKFKFDEATEEQIKNKRTSLEQKRKISPFALSGNISQQIKVLKQYALIKLPTIQMEWKEGIPLPPVVVDFSTAHSQGDLQKRFEELRKDYKAAKKKLVVSKEKAN